MAKINVEPLPPAPLEYTPQYQANMVRILQLALQRVNYARDTDLIREQAARWMGF